MDMNDNTPVSGLFATGKIYLIRTPISGRLGIVRLFDMLLAGELGIDFNPNSSEEIWVLMTNKARNRLRILHVDISGYELLVRINFDGLFDVVFEAGVVSKITRGQLRRLVLDGTIDGEWRSAYLRSVFEKFNIA